MLQSPRARGYTLTEMIIVTAIMGIGAAMVIPSLGSTNVSRLKGAAEVLTADISFAQVESISHGDDLRFMVFDTTNHSYYIAAASDLNTPITNPVGNAPYKVTFGEGHAKQFEGVTIQAVSVGGDDRLGFGMYGELDQGTDATITLASGGKTVVITVSPFSGEVSCGSIN